MTDESTADSGADDSRPDDAAEKLKANNAKLLKEAAEARQKARELEAWKSEREAADAAAQEEADKKAGEFAKIEAKLKGEADTFKAKYESLVSDRALTDAMIEAKIDDAYKPAVRALLKEKGVTITKDGEAQIEGKPVGEYVRAFAESDAGKPFILAGNSGGGAQGGGTKSPGEVNPWKAETLNRTTQAEILKTDPAKAARMKKEVGL